MVSACWEQAALEASPGLWWESETFSSPDHHDHACEDERDGHARDAAIEAEATAHATADGCDYAGVADAEAPEAGARRADFDRVGRGPSPGDKDNGRRGASLPA